MWGDWLVVTDSMRFAYSNEIYNFEVYIFFALRTRDLLHWNGLEKCNSAIYNTLGCEEITSLEKFLRWTSLGPWERWSKLEKLTRKRHDRVLRGQYLSYDLANGLIAIGSPTPSSGCLCFFSSVKIGRSAPKKPLKIRLGAKKTLICTLLTSEKR